MFQRASSHTRAQTLHYAHKHISTAHMFVPIFKSFIILAVNCTPTLSAPINGELIKRGTGAFGDTWTFSCNSGYALSGPTNVSCLSTAQWSSVAPTCQPVTCAAPNLPGNGTLSCLSMQYQGICNVQCDFGFSLIGVSWIICQANTTWSNAGICSPIHCPEVVSPAFGAVSVSGTVLGSSVSYACSIGYSLSGSQSATCLATGRWSTTAPTCSLITCPVVLAPANSSSGVCSQGLLNSVCNFTCKTGFVLSGSTSIVCRANGQWNASAPTCNPVVCPPFPTVSNAWHSGPVGLAAYNEQVNITCVDGYVLRGNATFRCIYPGLWSAPAPACSRK